MGQLGTPEASEEVLLVPTRENLQQESKIADDLTEQQIQKKQWVRRYLCLVVENGH